MSDERRELCAPVPLSAEDAYWHACTGTPYVQEFWPVRIDPACPPDRIYFMPQFIASNVPREKWPEDWQKYCGYVDKVKR